MDIIRAREKAKMSTEEDGRRRISKITNSKFTRLNNWELDVVELLFSRVRFWKVNWERDRLTKALGLRKRRGDNSAEENV